MNTIHHARHRVLILLGVALTGLLLAACGSSSSGSSSSTSNTTNPTANASATSGSTTARRAALRKCLAQHGVTLPSRPAGGGTPGGGAPPGAGNGAPPGAGNGAPPGAGGGLFGGGGARGFANNPKLAAAFRACGGAAFRGARRFQISHTAITKFVTCVRQHGFPSMPSPNFSGGPVFPTSIRTNSKFVAASRSCASLLVRPRPTTPSSSSGGTTSTS